MLDALDEKMGNAFVSLAMKAMKFREEWLKFNIFGWRIGNDNHWANDPRGNGAMHNEGV